MNFNSELMKKLSDCISPSGRENNIRELIINEIKDFADDINVDALGNLIVRKAGKGKKIMFSAHMDQIGFMITHVDEKGFLRFTNIGGLHPKEILGQRVVFDNEYEGIICSEKLEDKEKIAMNKLFIDVAITDSNILKENFLIGDICVFKTDYYETDNCVMCKAADDRAGCYVLIEAIKNHPNTDNDVYYVFSVQEEVGLRGAKTAGYSVNPDIAIALDVTATGDSLDGTKMDVKLNSGAAIKLMDKSIITHTNIKNLLTNLAIKNNIKYQYEILEFGGTDAGAIHTLRDGVPSGVISIPTRNIHSSGEIFSKEDIKECLKLTLAVCNSK